jgi:predicted Rossmann-fold nucleotide-binding protein
LEEHVNRKRILFQGSLAQDKDNPRQVDKIERPGLALEISTLLGERLILAGFDLVLTGSDSLMRCVGTSAVAACVAVPADPKDRICTYIYHDEQPVQDFFGMVIKPFVRRWQDFRTFVVQQSDAIVAVVGGKGTADALQKGELARLPLFPVAIAGGGAEIEWERLNKQGYCNRKSRDLDFLADKAATPDDMTRRIVEECRTLLYGERNVHSERILPSIPESATPMPDVPDKSSAAPVEKGVTGFSQPRNSPDRSVSRYDFFIAYATPDRRQAQELCWFLQEGCEVFLDVQNLGPGALWGPALREALEASRSIVVVVSTHADDAFYQQEEIVRAIQLARDKTRVHTVIPVILEQVPQGAVNMPYGLSGLQARDATRPGGLERVAAELVAWLNGPNARDQRS